MDGIRGGESLLNYLDTIDQIFSENGNKWEHRTLRTIFDPLSHEWNETSMAEKKDILKKIVHSGTSLDVLIHQYLSFYLEQNRIDIIRELPSGLSEILTHILSC